LEVEMDGFSFGLGPGLAEVVMDHTDRGEVTRDWLSEKGIQLGDLVKFTFNNPRTMGLAARVVSIDKYSLTLHRDISRKEVLYIARSGHRSRRGGGYLKLPYSQIKTIVKLSE